jgi:hypothetical protein
MLNLFSPFYVSDTNENHLGTSPDINAIEMLFELTKKRRIPLVIPGYATSVFCKNTIDSKEVQIYILGRFL